MTSPTDFRAAFPAFADTTKYPDASIQFWLTWAPNLLNADRWGPLLDLGVQLFVAHNLSIDGPAVAAGGAAGNPGSVVGPQSEGHVDKVGYSRDASVAMLPGAGHWNLSTYGLRYKQLVALVGAGPIQVGVPGPETPMSGIAWPGPLVGYGYGY